MPKIELLNADCLDALPRIPTASVDAVIADPPYGQTDAEWDRRIDLDRLWSELIRITKPKAPIVLFAMQPYTSILVTSQPKLYRCTWVYEKTTPSGFLNAKRYPLRCHEDVVVFSQAAPNYYPQHRKTRAQKKTDAGRKLPETIKTFKFKLPTREYDGTKGYPRSVIKFANPRIRGGHPTEKPIEVIRYLVRTYSQPEDRILDFCVGRGTTALAAQLENRHCIAIEKDPTKFAEAKDRLRPFLKCKPHSAFANSHD